MAHGPVRQSFASKHPNQWTSMDFRGLGSGYLNGAQSRTVRRKAEGEGFEPSIRLTTDNGFRDRRIRPLCHPSGART
jgi:hypothetical protein